MYAWYQAYMEHLEADPDRAVFVLVHQGDELEAIIPLQKSRIRYCGILVPVLRTFRHSHFSLHDVLLDACLDHRHLVSELLAYLNSHADYACSVLQFDKFPDDSAIMDLMRNEESLSTSVIAAGACDYLTVRSSENLLGDLSRNFRRNLRKARNKLVKHASVEFLSTRETGNLRQFYEQFLEVEASGWKGPGGTRTAILLHPSLVAFYEHLLRAFGESGHCEINLLRVDGATIAAQFALDVGDTYYVLKIGYDEKHAELAPGNTLLAHVIERLSKEETIRNVNLITDTAWHDKWRPLHYDVFCCLFYRSWLVAVLVRTHRFVGRLRSAVISAYSGSRRVNCT